MVLSFIVLILYVIVGAILGVPIVADNTTQISIAAFDNWSVGHTFCGIGLFKLCFIIGLNYKTYKFWKSSPNPPPTSPAPVQNPGIKGLIVCLSITIGVAIIWEIIENTILLSTGVKTQPDSIINASTDIIVWTIGSLLAWFTSDLIFYSKRYILAYYVYSGITLFLGFLIFFIFGALIS